MKRFGYCCDPLFLFAIAMYALNRWLVAPQAHGSFLSAYANDFFLIPAALPPVLWLQRRWNWRTQDHFPTMAEIAFHLLVWSVVCEVLGPKLFHHSVGDPLDVVAYALGGGISWLWWHRPANAAEIV